MCMGVGHEAQIVPIYIYIYIYLYIYIYQFTKPIHYMETPLLQLYVCHV